MDQDLKDFLDQRFDAMDQRFTEKIDAAKTSMFQRLEEMAATLDEGYRDTQTEVLKAVYSMGARKRRS